MNWTFWICLWVYLVVFVAMLPICVRANSIPLGVTGFVMALLWPLLALLGGLALVGSIIHTEWREIFSTWEKEVEM